MTRWYRRYTGTVSDPKIAEAAVVANCSRSVVIATLDAIFESAAELNEAGRFKSTPRNVAATLLEQTVTVENVFAALTELQIINDSVVCAWKKRQYESDSSTVRSRKHREIKNKKSDAPHATAMQRCATPPDTDTDTDTDTEDAANAASAREQKVAALPEVSNLEKLSDQLHSAAKPCLSPISAGLFSMAEPQRWLDGGCDLDRDILPTIAVVVGKGKTNIGSWSYFTTAVTEARARRVAGLPAVTVNSAGQRKSKIDFSQFEIVDREPVRHVSAALSSRA